MGNLLRRGNHRDEGLKKGPLGERGWPSIVHPLSCPTCKWRGKWGRFLGVKRRENEYRKTKEEQNLLVKL